MDSEDHMFPFSNKLGCFVSWIIFFAIKLRLGADKSPFNCLLIRGSKSSNGFCGFILPKELVYATRSEKLSWNSLCNFSWRFQPFSWPTAPPPRTCSPGPGPRTSSGWGRTRCCRRTSEVWGRRSWPSRPLPSELKRPVVLVFDPRNVRFLLQKCCHS